MKVVPLRLRPGDDLRLRGDLEILSLAGTLSPTTAELVVGLLPQWRFSRELDPATGYEELRISPRTPD